MDKNKHLYFLRRVLRDIYSDDLLSSELKFKGGTAAMFFRGLPRFSTDLDFNLTNRDSQPEIFARLQTIVRRHGEIFDASDKRFGPLIVLDYGKNERKLKIEVSNRVFDNHYQVESLGNILIPVMTVPDAFTHKLCAFLTRRAPRDVFDVWFFLSKGDSVNPNIIKERFDVDLYSFMTVCREQLSKITPSDMMQGIGELLDDNMKDFVRSGRLLHELEGMLVDFRDYPVISDAVSTEHTRLLFQEPSVFPFFNKKDIDPSTVSVQELQMIHAGETVSLLSRENKEISFCQKSGRIIIDNVRGNKK